MDVMQEPAPAHHCNIIQMHVATKTARLSLILKMMNIVRGLHCISFTTHCLISLILSHPRKWWNTPQILTDPDRSWQIAGDQEIELEELVNLHAAIRQGDPEAKGMTDDDRWWQGRVQLLGRYALPPYGEEDICDFHIFQNWCKSQEA